MTSLSDSIEEYLKKLIAMSARSCIDLQRKEIAEKFNCVPSQINYVLSTRFTLEKGYLVETRRGGGGYVRVTRVNLPHKGILITALSEILDKGLEVKEGKGLIRRLYEERIITLREGRMIQAALESFPTGEKYGRIRGELLKNMLKAVLKDH